MPLSRRLYLGASIYTEIFGRLPGTRHSLRFPRSFFPAAGGGNGRTGVVHADGRRDGRDGERRVKATVRNFSPFVGYQASANRCLQLPPSPRFRASRGCPSPCARLFALFSAASRALCLYQRRREKRRR